MKVSRIKIAGAVADRTLKSGITSELGKEVAAYLLDTNRVKELDSILRDIQQNWADHGIVEVIASSAYPLTTSVKDQIASEVKKAFPEAEQIIISENLDPKVLEGVRLNFANRQLDLSAQSKLNKFRQLTMAGKE